MSYICVSEEVLKGTVIIGNPIGRFNSKIKQLITKLRKYEKGIFCNFIYFSVEFDAGSDITISKDF